MKPIPKPTTHPAAIAANKPPIAPRIAPNAARFDMDKIRPESIQSDCHIWAIKSCLVPPKGDARKLIHIDEAISTRIQTKIKINPIKDNRIIEIEVSCFFTRLHNL